ncbi:hypothetical protein [Haemophilus influenzae]|uniref:hypothetical protein n=1 Tax=Haemophilus influenzae TaxID=727 RepID=UPI000D01A22B|nr:hypothetical protein [Haemophilus influenzae]PRM48675.1 lipopolysaccharide biosynthesis protein WzzE [Haemophilus influenzae]
MRKFILSFLFILIGGGLGFAGAHVHPIKWQVRAQFEAPKINELGNYFSLFSTYSLVSGDADAVNMVKIERKATDSAYHEFTKILNSSAQLMAFLNQSDFVKARAKLENETVQQIASHFKFSQENNLDQFILSSFDRDEVDQLFVEYIRYVNNQARQTLNNELITKWKSLFEQVKNAADAKIDISWENKLKMMQSVQPLDNNLVAFHFVQQPNLVMAEKPYVISTGIGAGFGIILSLLAMLILGAGRNKKAKE